MIQGNFQINPPTILRSYRLVHICRKHYRDPCDLYSVSHMETSSRTVMLCNVTEQQCWYSTSLRPLHPIITSVGGVCRGVCVWVHVHAYCNTLVCVCVHTGVCMYVYILVCVHWCMCILISLCMQTLHSWCPKNPSLVLL